MEEKVNLVEMDKMAEATPSIAWCLEALVVVEEEEAEMPIQIMVAPMQELEVAVAIFRAAAAEVLQEAPVVVVGPKQVLVITLVMHILLHPVVVAAGVADIMAVAVVAVEVAQVLMEQMVEMAEMVVQMQLLAHQGLVAMVAQMALVPLEAKFLQYLEIITATVANIMSQVNQVQCAYHIYPTALAAQAAAAAEFMHYIL